MDDEAAAGAGSGQGGSAASGGGVDPRLLDLLVCPLTKGPLRYDRGRSELVSEQAGLAYPIRDGIPIMLVDEARPVSEADRIPREVRADDDDGSSR